MLRQKWGSVVCPACNMLVGVNDERCLNCGRWNPGMWGFAPLLTRFGRDMGFVPLVMTSCIVLYVLTLFGDPVRTSVGIFDLVTPTLRANVIFGASGYRPVVIFGRWWTVLTASWLHANLIHIAVNMMSLRAVAPIVSEFYGASRMIIIYVVSGIVGFTVSTFAGAFFGFIPFLGGASYTVGASASIAGLIGAIYYYGNRAGNRGAAEQSKMWIFSFLLMGFLLGGLIDNWAHIGGLAGGYFCSKFLDPLHPERLDHFVIALASLLITAVAIIVSVITGYRMFL